jgi:hypothetical protein
MSWIPDWGMDDGIASIRKNPTRWGTISPVWFTPNKNGTVNKERTFNSATLLKLLRDNNIRLVPTISLFDADILQEILNKNLDKHVAEIVSLVEKNNYAGIDLDYESTYEADRLLLTEFITKLAGQLHQKNKTLSFTALRKLMTAVSTHFFRKRTKPKIGKQSGLSWTSFESWPTTLLDKGAHNLGRFHHINGTKYLLNMLLVRCPQKKLCLHCHFTRMDGLNRRPTTCWGEQRPVPFFG